MADRVRKVSYCYVVVPGRTGQGAPVLDAVRKAGVNMIGFTGFPTKGGRAQLDIVAPTLGPIRRAAKANGWRVSSPKKAFHIQGPDVVGAVSRHISRLADAGINVVGANAASAGSGRYGMLLWVRPKDYARAAKALKAK